MGQGTLFLLVKMVLEINDLKELFNLKDDEMLLVAPASQLGKIVGNTDDMVMVINYKTLMEFVEQSINKLDKKKVLDSIENYFKKTGMSEEEQLRQRASIVKYLKQELGL